MMPSRRQTFLKSVRPICVAERTLVRVVARPQAETRLAYLSETRARVRAVRKRSWACGGPNQPVSPGE